MNAFIRVRKSSGLQELDSSRQKRGCTLFNIHKSNVLATSRFWNKVVEQVWQKEFSGVRLENQLVDSTAYGLVKTLANIME